MNGIVAADASPHPGLKATLFCHRNLRVTSADPKSGVFNIKSWFDFKNASEMLSGHWSIRENGKVTHTGELTDLDIEPHQEKEIKIDIPPLSEHKTTETVLRFEFKALATMNPMVEAEHLLGWDEFILQEKESFPELTKSSSSPPKVEEANGKVKVTGKDFQIVLDRGNGQLTSWNVEGMERLSRGLQPDFWRFVDNDMRRFEKKSSSIEWAQAGPAATVDQVEVQPASSGEAVTIQVNYSFPAVGGRGEVV